MLSHYFKKLSDWLLPSVCIFCNHLAESATDLCFSCKQNLPWIQNACIQCGLALFKINERCGNCLRQSPSFDKTFAIFYYKSPIRQIITRLKFHEKLLYAQILGELMAEKMASHYSNTGRYPDCIIPIPLHPKRQMKRGFNQALELARPISKRLKISIDSKNCKRILNTQAQSSIPAAKRSKNIKNAFEVSDGFEMEHVLIIDDVITTGNTIEELSKVLKKAQVRQIDVCSVARTVLE